MKNHKRYFYTVLSVPHRLTLSPLEIDQSRFKESASELKTQHFCMKFYRYIYLLMGCFLVVNLSFSQTKIMSYNIRYDNPNDGLNRWELRKDEVVQLLQYYDADFIGIQEALPQQVQFIADHLQNYAFIGHGRDGLGTNSESTPIFYNRSKYKLLKNELFWLSSTPKKVSKGWDADLNRIVVYAKFKSRKTKKIIHVFNTHFDHIGEQARLMSAKLLLDYITKNDLSHKKVVLMGDFNLLPNAPPIMLLEQELENSYKTKNTIPYGPIGTFNGFTTDAEVTRQIDYIFTKNVPVKSYRCIDDRRANNLQLSDHFPVMIELF